MQLIKALFGETEQKEFKFGSSTVVLRTLTQGEIDEIMSKVVRSDMALLELQKIPILARAIVSINNVVIEAFEEVREAIKADPKVDIKVILEKSLMNMDANSLSILFDFYLTLKDESYKKKEQLKNS